ncbi:type I-E CRISPR-associated protein Cse2/CasB [Nonomuraea endophytica]|uniref:CRISPR system Cascade subunit CasB n=1 Tax=Nonomuraea endophytica TaxID=714136 RepID=A0A7W8AH62_9ACTN|nr:type I-E CRISPR-associated protein Cse2/CasB [Nonomuraea endophytica]MBB5085070.1 CRISPR system Cascade subunit CasB [Nonomuraea endophytica]
MTATPTPTSPAELVGTTTGAYLAPLQRGYLNDESWAVSLLARLRRGAGKLPQDVPDLWGATGLEELHHQLPPRSGDTALERAEAAQFIAVTLYALHQQSRRTTRMHHPGTELGTAVRRLMPGGAIDEPIRRRFVRAGTATTRQALAERLRDLVSLLHRESIPIDYALLAQRLYQAQLPDGMRQVRQRWGRSFHAHRPAATPADTAPSPAHSPGEADD